MDTDDGALSLQETARLLGLPVTSVRKMTNDGTLGSFRTSGGWRRIRREDLLTMMNRPDDDVIALLLNKERPGTGTDTGTDARVRTREHHVDDDRALTVLEIANLLNVYRGSVTAWIRNGRLSAFTTPDGRYRVWRSELDRAMREVNGDAWP